MTIDQIGSNIDLGINVHYTRLFKLLQKEMTVSAANDGTTIQTGKLDQISRIHRTSTP